LPNVSLWLGLVLLARREWVGATVCGLFALTVIVLGTVLLSQDHDEPLNLGIGYYVWVASMGLLAFGGLFRRG
jgi:hypothetical protein